MFHVEAIAYDRVEELLAMLREREAWMESIGQPMWDPAYLERGPFLERYGYPPCFLAYDGAEAVGGFILVEKDALWADRPDALAFYIHKLVVDRKYAGLGYAAKALEWIAEFGKANGKECLRLDYYDDRACLSRLYGAGGFTRLDARAMPDGTILARAERRL